MNTNLLYRLAWKELRTLRALWLTLFVTAFVLQVGPTGFIESSFDRWRWIFGVMLFIPAIYALASTSLMFAGESEEGTDQFLCRLATPPRMVLVVKFGLSVLATAALLGVLYLWLKLRLRFAGLQSIPLSGENSPELVNQFMTAMAWTIGFLSFGLFFSLVFRRVMPCLVATIVATTVMSWTPFGTGGASEQLGWLVRMGVISGSLMLASMWLVPTWDEDRWPRTVERLLDVWRRVTATSERRAESPHAIEHVSGGWRVFVRPFGLYWPDEWLPAWRREARRLLWLEWRQARRVMLFVLAAFGVYLACQKLLVAWGSVLVAKEFPFVMALVAFVFGAWSFQAQQSGQRFRGFARHGASPVAMWCIKQGVWFAVTLLTMVILASIAAWLSGGRHFVYWEPGHESLWRRLGYGLSSGELAQWHRSSQLLSESLGGVVSSSVLAVGLCFGVGQLVSLLMARAVTAATVGFVLAALAFGWQQLSALAAIPPLLAVLPLIVGLLLASAVRMTDWLEERNSLRGWLRVIAACVVPSLVTLIGVPIYRVEEVPSAMSAEFDWYDVRHLTANDVSPDAKQTAQRWMRLAESLSSQATFRRKVSVFPNAVTGVIEQDQWSVPDFSEIQLDYVSWDTLNDRDWIVLNAKQVSEAARIAQQLDCAFDREFFTAELAHQGIPQRRLTQLAVLLKMAAESAMSEGKLDESLQHGLVLLRLSEHIQQHAQYWQAHNGERLEVAAWGLLNRWVRHPAQTGDSLRAALGRSANEVPHPLLVALKKHVELLPTPEVVVAEELSVTKKELATSWRDAAWPVSWMFWERQRAESVLDYSAAVALENLRLWINDSRENWEGDTRLAKRSSWVNYPPTRKQSLAAFLQESTQNPNAGRHHDFVWSGEYAAFFSYVNERAEAAVWRRGLVATLALRAFQLDHGRWPTQWDELVGPYLDRVPVDPWNGLPFELRPQGYPFELKTHHGHVPADTPLLVSRGPYNQHLELLILPAAEGGTSSTPKWFAIGPHERLPWPPKDGEGRLHLIAIPLNVTE